jgi:hypothetical protein
MINVLQVTFIFEKYKYNNYSKLSNHRLHILFIFNYLRSIIDN